MSVINTNGKADMLELLGKLPQIVQHLWRQFTTGVGRHVHLYNSIEQPVNLFKHSCANILVLFDCLVSVGQFQCSRMPESHLPVLRSRETAQCSRWAAGTGSAGLVKPLPQWLKQHSDRL
jgi:hypothetical protein